MANNNFYIPLAYRAVIKISGKDCKKFLQTIVSNDINKLSADNSIYALMLTPQGKFLYDFFICEYEDSLLLDVAKTHIDTIIKKLSMYKLRLNISIQDVTKNYEVVVLTGDSVFNEIKKKAGTTKKFCKGCAFIDPRNENMFARAIIEKENDYQAFKAKGFSLGEESVYQEIRINNKIPEANVDIITQEDFPLHFAMDKINAIDFNKGCYVGQEVTARMHYRGKINKSLDLFQLKSGKMPGFGATIKQHNKKIGYILSSIKNKALALVNIAKADDNNNLFYAEDAKLLIIG